MRTRPILAAAALLLAAGLAAVTHQAVSQADEPLRIGTTYMTMNNPFYSVIDEELRLVIESHGDILLTRDPALDQERQNEEIRDLLHEDIDLLVLNPVDYREIEPALREAQKAGVPIISCMGAGNKLDASALEVADIYDTSVCPLARVMRAELRKRGVKHLKVVYSKEPALTPIDDMTISCRTHCICPPDTAHKCTQRRQVPGSNAFVPAAAGLIIAGEVVRDIANGEPQKK